MLTIPVSIREVGLELGFTRLEDAWRMRMKVGMMISVILIVMPQTWLGGTRSGTNGHKPIGCKSCRQARPQPYFEPWIQTTNNVKAPNYIISHITSNTPFHNNPKFNIWMHKVWQYTKSAQNGGYYLITPFLADFHTTYSCSAKYLTTVWA